jgi:hypothetical protein
MRRGKKDNESPERKNNNTESEREDRRSSKYASRPTATQTGVGRLKSVSQLRLHCAHQKREGK